MTDLLEYRYEVWHEGELVYEGESLRDAYEVAGDFKTVIWLVDHKRNICKPMPWMG